MVAIVGKDLSRILRVTCSGCASILEYTKSETRQVKHYDYTGGCDIYCVINCPCCSKEINVS